MTLYRRQGSTPSPRKRNAKRQNGCLRRPYKELRKERESEKRRESKGKGEKEIYTYLNAEFQTIARRDKKAIEENNSMKKTRDLFKKIRDKGNIS